MSYFKKEYLESFLENQGRLFDRPVADTLEEADSFLVDCMAEVADSPEEIRECLDGFGMDFSDLSDRELLEAAEVFPLPDGKYMVVQA
ncbi:MAG: glyoxalase [Lachnospiraceae bacterium]|nr:glyoxalase [Lachnospiraceae bacterium]